MRRSCLYTNRLRTDTYSEGVTGANNLSLAWGPAIGAKVVGFEVAAPVGAVCAVVGAILFGDRNAPIYGGYLKSYTVLQDLPELTIYAMMWWPLVLLIWQVMALYWQVPVVPYLGFGESPPSYAAQLVNINISAG